MNWVTVCGGGNGAHALIGTILLHDQQSHVRLYLPIENERKRFEDAIDTHSQFNVHMNGQIHAVSSERIRVTGDARTAADSPVIIIAVPAFAHEAVLSQLAPHIGGRILAVLPARSGLEFQAREIFAAAEQHRAILVGFQTLPWACRTEEFGRSVVIYGTKKRLGVASMPAEEASSKAGLFSELFGMEIIPYGSMVELSLTNTGQLIHPGIMYGVFSERLQRMYSSESDVPLFYGSVDTKTASILSAMSEEVLDIRDAVERVLPGVVMPNVVHLSRWLSQTYAGEISDTSNLMRKFQTNKGYQTLKAPVKEQEQGYVIDTQARYLSEDLPFGLVVTRGIGSLVGVKTPTIDEVIINTSAWIGREYLAEGELVGRDIMTTRAPQRYGITAIESLFE